MNRALLIGGSGQLGSEIVRRWIDWEIVAPSHDDLDLEGTDALEAAIERTAPDALVNAAAFHNVDRCETEPERAFAVNALAVARAARACRDRAVKFVTISSDYVFDGAARRPYREGDPVHPVSVYGASKLAGELLVEALRSNALVIRTCGVYGVRPSARKGYTFVDRVIAQARAGERLRIVSDVAASPTFAGHLAQALNALIASGAEGLYHAANVGPVSWYDFAREALVQARIDDAIEPISVREWRQTARRPAFSALDSGKLASIGFQMPTWREGIGEYLTLAQASQALQKP